MSFSVLILLNMFVRSIHCTDLKAQVLTIYEDIGPGKFGTVARNILEQIDFTSIGDAKGHYTDTIHLFWENNFTRELRTLYLFVILGLLNVLGLKVQLRKKDAKLADYQVQYALTSDCT